MKDSRHVNLFSRVTRWISLKAGQGITFFLACLILVIWALVGPIYHFSDTWQLVINTGTSVVTFLMVFLIQNTQNRDMIALQIKLDELIRVIGKASNELLNVEEFSDKEIERLHQHYEELPRRIRPKSHKKRQKN